MDLIPISKYPVGTNAVHLANFDRSMEDHLIGTEIHSGIPIAFPNVGEIEEGVMTLYNVTRTGAKFHGAWILSSIPGFPPKSIGLQFLRTLASSMMFVVDWVVLQLAWIFCIMLVVFQVM